VVGVCWLFVVVPFRVGVVLGFGWGLGSGVLGRRRLRSRGLWSDPKKSSYTDHESMDASSCGCMKA
jgi:hypothetical protein